MMENKIDLKTFKEVRLLEKEIREDLLKDLIHRGVICVNDVTFYVNAFEFVNPSMDKSIRLVIKLSINGAVKEYDKVIDLSEKLLSVDLDTFRNEKIRDIAIDIAKDLIAKDLAKQIFECLNKNK